MDKFVNKTNGGGVAMEAAPSSSAAAAPKKGAKVDIEKTYQKKSQLEHILLRPDTYIGSVEHVKETMWVYDKTAKRMVQREVSYVPGLYKIFDEILVNAADNKQRDAKMDKIKIDINQETNTVSVYNNGQGIPVVMHKEEKMYVPTMIFGHLLTSSNYNDEEEKVTGGRNGYGAKLCNIFSSKFTLETSSKQYKSKFKQTWGDNMKKVSDPKVTPSTGEDFTQVTFTPDLAKFKMDRLDDDIVAIMSRRAYDIAASTRKVKVFLNGELVPVKSFQDYTKLYLESPEEEGAEKPTIVYETVNERWEIAFSISDKGFQQVSFVNSIATTKGGRHVDMVADTLTKQLTELLKKKNKGGVAVKPFEIRNHMWLFINCLIVNPTFDSQTKENMTLQAKSFGSKCVPSEKFFKNMTKMGIVERILEWAHFKQAKALDKTSGRKATTLRGVPKLEDANDAGGKNSINCTLILTEGDSAKATAMSGLGVIGRDLYGVFPLRGKLLNVREATHKQRMENLEICNLVKIIGLQYKQKYETLEDMKKLRYGKVMIMTDQDQDGSHIKGLVINFFHHHWPELLRMDFLEEFITPIVKVSRTGRDPISFYSLPEYEEWRAETPDALRWKTKYYKGLGTSDSKEAREYFANLERHLIKFRYEGRDDDQAILMAFSKDRIAERKEWLTNHMNDCKRRKELGLPDQYLYGPGTKSITYKDFVNLELVLFSNMDNERSIPNMMDGLKPGQRKILFVGFKTGCLNREQKVAQLSGQVANVSAYHHGEVSLQATIVNMAQNFVGSNNINLLMPNGQFGTRLTGGKDSASARYIHTQFSPLTTLIFRKEDEPLLTYQEDDNVKVEPVYYVPIIPMCLVNGAEGIGTGWSTKIPNYNPRDLIKCCRLMLAGQEPVDLRPWYKNFRGEMQTWSDRNAVTRCICIGNVSLMDDNKIEITELPIGTWTSTYRENVLDPMCNNTEKTKATVHDYKQHNTDDTVRFVVQMKPGELEKLQAVENGIYKHFKLMTNINTTQMHAFDSNSCLRRYESPQDMVREFFGVRLTYYERRKEYLIGQFGAVANSLSARARFIEEKCSGALTVENKKKKELIKELIKRGFPSDPIAEWKKKTPQDHLGGKATNATNGEEAEEEDEGADESGYDFNYLVGMSMWFLTEEKKQQLLKEREQRLAELSKLKMTSIQQMWLDELTELEVALEEHEKREKLEMESAGKEKVKGGKKGVKAEPKGARGKAGKNSRALDDFKPSADATKIDFQLSEQEKAKYVKPEPKAPGEARVKKEKVEKGAAAVKKEKADSSVVAEGDGQDDLDAMIAGKKKAPAIKKEKSADGMKQSKLDFSGSKAGKKATPKRKKKKGSDSEDDEMSNASNSDVEFSISDAVPMRERPSGRAASKKITYKFDDDEEKSDGDEPEMFDNTMVEEGGKTGAAEVLSDSDDGGENGKNNTSAEDMFDSLREEDSPVKKKAAPKKAAAASSKRKPGSDEEVKKKAPAKKKKKMASDVSGSDDDFSPVKKAGAKKAAGGRKKKAVSESESDFDDY